MHRFRINDIAKKTIACSLFPAAAVEKEEEERKESSSSTQKRVPRVSGLATSMVHSPLTPEIGLRVRELGDQDL